MNTNNNKSNLGFKNSKDFWENLIAILTFVTLLVALVIGFNRSQTDVKPFIAELVPGSTRFEKLGFEKFAVYNDSLNALAGYVSVCEFDGFGGPLKVATATDTLGAVINVKIVDHKETPTWYDRVIESRLIDDLKEKKFTDEFVLGKDLDGVTGATYTTRAISECVKASSREIAVDELGFAKPKSTDDNFNIGFPELALVLLLLAGLFGVKNVPTKYKKKVVWLIMLSGLFIIGFMYNHQLTLVDINKFLMGYWPSIYHQLYWYILIFGVLIIFLTTKKNVYCSFICPFGAAQECIALIANAKNIKSKPMLEFLKWFRRGIVWVAVLLALLLRNPGFSSYEIYSTFFSLSGTNWEAFFLVTFIILALFIKRAWCKILCPIQAFEDYLRWFTKLLNRVSWKKKMKTEKIQEYNKQPIIDKTGV